MTTRFYISVVVLAIFGIAIGYQLFYLQFVKGDTYRAMAEKQTFKNFVIPANRGNIYSDNGSLLATSVLEFDIRFDAVTVSQKNFNLYYKSLADTLSVIFGKPASHYRNVLHTAKVQKKRYVLIAKAASYTQYLALKKAPLFNLGPYKGGFIAESKTVRAHPLGKLGARLVGMESTQKPGNYLVGLEGAFDTYLRGKSGRRLKQKIAKGQWKPVSDENQIEPQQGQDVVSTLNVDIQDIAHHALLKQLEFYKADHGCVVVMEVATGAIKAMANLGRTSNGNYYEKLNYAVGESHEPGSTFKTMAFLAALEAGKIDTTTVVDTKQGSAYFYGREITDSKRGGYGEISAGKALEVSSNIGLARLLDDGFSENPNAFINYLKQWRLHQPLEIPIKGEGSPVIPEPGHKLWSRNALPSMAYGYNLRLTPLQVLTFYNAIANQGAMVAPRFMEEIRAQGTSIHKVDTNLRVTQIAKPAHIKIMQDLLKNVVERGTGKGLQSPYFTMAGKTGTAQTEYWMPDWKQNRRYVSSFVGYFPAENPTYSCIVVVHKPQWETGYYGADVAGPVFSRIAQKINLQKPETVIVNNLVTTDPIQENSFQTLNLNATYSKIPNLKGMEAMDAIALLETIGLKVKLVGNGKVKKQSITPGKTIQEGALITLYLG